MYINGKKLNVKQFSSGELKLLRSELDKHIENGEVEILHTGDMSMFELMLIIDYYINNNILVNVILSYLPYQRMDHKNTNEVDTLSNVARVLNRFNLNSLTICEPHGDISDFKNAKEFGFVKQLKERVFSEIGFNKNTDTVVLTDKGGYKRYNNLAENMCYFNKARDKQTGLIIKHEIVGKVDINGKIVIVDDIISTGDTIINIVEMLSDLGAKDIYILSGHFEKNKFNNRLINHKNIKKIFSTNSLRKRQNKKLKLYKVEEIFYGKNN